MSFNFTCPFCNQVMQCEDAWNGMEAQCPACGKQITLSSAKPAVSVSPVLIPKGMSNPECAAMTKKARSKIALVWIVTLAVALISFYGLIIWVLPMKVEEIKKELVKESEKLVEKIIEGNNSDIDVTEVEVKALKKIEGNKYKYEATAYVTQVVRNNDKGNGRTKHDIEYLMSHMYSEKARWKYEIMIEIRDRDLYVEIVSGSRWFL